MFNWFRKNRRRKILQTPFPQIWRDILVETVLHYQYLDQAEKEQLEQLVQVFISEKSFEGCGGLELTDEIKVVIAAQASLLVLGLPSFQYRDLDSILVYPTTVTLPESRPGVFSESWQIVPDQQAILGQAWLRGPVILVWDAVLRGVRHPERGHNVVYHEFAHILDMRDGSADGTPELHGVQLYRRWVEICSKEFFRLKKRVERGEASLLDPYGAVHEAEFFAVATELFFDRPLRMEKEYPKLYNVLQEYYQQDTAARQRRYREKNGDDTIAAQ
ncbi:MAG: M90 family metallopeptidase [Desulforhopalus sp.]